MGHAPQDKENLTYFYLSPPDTCYTVGIRGDFCEKDGGTRHFRLFDEEWYRNVMNLFRDTTDPKSRYEYDLINQPAAY